MAVPRELISYDRGLVAPITTSISTFKHYGKINIPSFNLWNPVAPLRISIVTSGTKS